MPRTIPVGYGEAAIITTSSIGSGPFVTTFGVSLIGIDPAEYVDAADRILLAYQTAFSASMSSDTNTGQCVLSVGLPGGTSGSVSSSGTSVANTGGGSYAPFSMALIARKQSADLGRKGRGRCFLPCLVKEDQVDAAGALTGSTVAAFDELWNDFLVELATAEVGSATPMVLLHNDDSTPTPVTAGSIAPLVGWVRKRIR